MPPRPELSFCTSADGTRIAMATQGKGRAVVMVQLIVSDDLDAPGVITGPWADGLTDSARLVTYDVRGTGLSDRSMQRCTLDAWTEDLEAVIDTLGSEPVMLLAHSQGSMLAVHYASLHPERVSHLVVYGGIARGRLRRGDDAAALQETNAQREAMVNGWGNQTAYSSSFRHVFYRINLPQADAAMLARLDELTLHRWSQETVIGYSDAIWATEVTRRAPQVRCPTLAFHARGDRAHLFDEGRRLAALIPGARFVPIDSDNHFPVPETDGYWPGVLAEVRTFLGLAATPASQSAASPSDGALTARQAEVLRLVGQGQTDKEIARVLGLSPRTVEMHVANAIEACGAKTRAEAVHKATAAGWLR